MTGGNLQLAAIGAQDIQLTGKPEYNFFKSVHKRYFNFAIESIVQEFRSTPDFGKRLNVIISKNGDLMNKMYFHFTLPVLERAPGASYTGWTNSIGHAIIEDIELRIGGIKIDKDYGLFMEIWDELTTTEDKRAAMNLMLGKYELAVDARFSAETPTEYFVPLRFWFNRIFALSLPIVALQYHEIELIFNLRPFSECIIHDGTEDPPEVSITKGELLVDYIFLTDKLRSQFAKKQHFFLMDQLQINERKTISPASSVFKPVHREITFNHPIKELFWVLVETESENNNDWFNFSRRADTSEQIISAKLTMEGNDRIEERTEAYFRLVQPYQHNTHPTNKHIYVYSFGESPEENQPSGTLNFSKVDQFVLELKVRPNNPETNLYNFGMNYNVLILSNGMAALAYYD